MKDQLITANINCILDNFKNSDGTIFHINHFKLQKLAFFCHAQMLIESNGQSPFTKDELFQAWVNGPVLPSLYGEFKDHRPSEKLTRYAESDADEDNHYTLKSSSRYFRIIDNVLTNYADFSSSRLIDLSHEKGSPWDLARTTKESNPEIEDSTILAYYKEPETALLR